MMAKKSFIDQLLTSRKFQNSLVAFLPELLKRFFSGEIDEATFKQEFEDKSVQAKMYLLYMKEYIKDIKANQKIFRNEFYLTDRINHAIYEFNLSGQEFKDALKKYIVDYNKANKNS